MSEWKKVEDPVSGASEPAPQKAQEPAPEKTAEPAPAPKKEAPPPAEPPSSTLGLEPEDIPTGDDADKTPAPRISEPKPPASKRYTAAGRRKGHFRYAAPLGLLVILLALTGVVSLIVLGVNGIRKAVDDTEVKAEIFEFLEPVTANQPVTAFTDINATEQDALIMAAVWKITNQENIRMLREKDDVCSYAQTDDGSGRIIVPLSEINEAYASLFGPDAKPYHHNIGDEGLSFSFEYKAEENCYYVPLMPNTPGSEPVAGELKKKGKTYTLQVGYVPVTKIGVDEQGKTITPTIDMAESSQYYTVQKTDDGWMLTAVSDTKP